MIRHTVVAMAAACALAAPPVLAQETAYASAQQAYAEGRYTQAFALFAQAADEGHCDAARIALLMQRYGAALYAADFGAPADRVQRWRLVAPCVRQQTVQAQAANAREAPR